MGERSESETEVKLLGEFGDEAIRLCRAAVALRFKHHSPHPDHVDGILLRPIVDIIWDTHRLAQALREDITWTQYWPSYPLPGQTYIPAQMQLTVETDRPVDEVKRGAPRVNCALSLGLTFRSVKPRLIEGVALRAEVLLGDTTRARLDSTRG